MELCHFQLQKPNVALQTGGGVKRGGLLWVRTRTFGWILGRTLVSSK